MMHDHDHLKRQLEGMRVRTTHNDYGSGIAASLGAEVVFMAIMVGLSKAQGKTLGMSLGHLPPS